MAIELGKDKNKAFRCVDGYCGTPVLFVRCLILPSNIRGHVFSFPVEALYGPGVEYPDPCPPVLQIGKLEIPWTFVILPQRA